MGVDHGSLGEDFEVLRQASLRPGAHPDKAGFLGALHRLIHSTHAKDRDTAIEMMQSLGEPDRTKVLIQFFDECMWRESKLAVLLALSRDPSPRGLEFLLEVAGDDSDLGLAKAAIEALGKSGRPLAAHYLSERYESGDDPLLPYVVCALGQLHCDRVRGRLLPALEKITASECHHPLLAQALIVALAEQSAFEAAPLLVRLAESRSLQRNVRLSALLALQHVASDARALAHLGDTFTETFFEQQLFATTVRKAEQRAAVTLEDLVSALSKPGPVDPSVAAELDRFPAKDLAVALELLQQLDPDPVKVSQVLRHSYHDHAHYRHLELLDPRHSVPTLVAVLGNLEHHVDPVFGPALEQVLELARSQPSPELFDAWCTAVVAALPNGTSRVLGELQLHGHALPLAASMCAVNRVTQRLLTMPRKSERFREGCTALARLFFATEHPELRGRVLRACGQLRHSDKQVVKAVIRAVADPVLRSSALVYMELCPTQQAAKLLAAMADDLLLAERTEWSTLVLFFRAAGAQPALPDDFPALDQLLVRALIGDFGDDVLVRALAVLVRHARPKLVAPVVQLSRRPRLDERVWLWVIGALKSLAPAEATAILAGWLRNEPKGPSESVRGRSLDALCALDDDEARRQVVTLLSESMDDLEICDKIVRCLTPPKSQRRQLAEHLERILQEHPDHEFHDAISMLRDRITYDAEHNVERDASTEELRDVDTKLKTSVPGYETLPGPIRAALRAAELPYLHKDIYHEQVDKSVCIMGYCKAIDLMLLESLGRRTLFPTLRRSLSLFQNVLVALGLHGELPNALELHGRLRLGPNVQLDDLPMHKMRRICRSVYDGSIQRESLRMIDGLSAWGIVLLLFVRGEGTGRRNFYPILLPRAADRDILDLAVSLLRLQTERNTAAHRGTILEFLDVSRMRSRSLKVMRRLDALFNDRSG